MTKAGGRRSHPLPRVEIKIASNREVSYLPLVMRPAETGKRGWGSMAERRGVNRQKVLERKESSQIPCRGRPICLSVGRGRGRSLAPILNDVFLSMSLIKSLADTAPRYSEAAKLKGD